MPIHRTNHQFNYQLVRSNRRSISVSVSYTGIKVAAPYHCPVKIIEQFIAAKQDWLQQKITLLQQQNNSYRPGHFMLLGQLITPPQYLKPITDYRLPPAITVLLDAAYSQLGLENTTAAAPLYNWLHQAASLVLAWRLKHWGDLMRLLPQKFALSSAKTRWGSTSRQRNIRLNWRLIELAPPLIDYVCIHELAHLVHMNHSRAFWQLVASYCPDYKLCRQQLRCYSLQLPWQEKFIPINSTRNRLKPLPG